MIFAFYLLKVIVCSGILFGYYWVALRNKTFHQWNRFYLLIIAGLSILLPLLKINLSDKAPEVVRYITIGALDEAVVVMAQQKPLPLISAEQWGIILYAFVSAVLLLIALKALKGILNILRSHAVKKLEQVNFIDTEVSGTPFTFFNYLVWNRLIDLQSPNGKLIFRHELAHIQEKHTLDKLFIILLLIPFWSNPFFWLIRKELNDIHEFIADKKALEGNDSAALSQMILNALYPKHQSLFYSPFFQSSIKRRLQIFSIQHQKINYMNRILILPILILVGAAFTIKHESKQGQSSFADTEVNKSVKDTIPQKKENVLVQEISKTAVNKVENKNNITGKKVVGVFADTKNEIFLESDQIINKNQPNETTTSPITALLIVNGKKVENTIWADKTIIAGKLTIYPKDDQEAIQLYGPEAAKGTMVFEDAKIISKAESEFYKERLNDTIPKKEKDSSVFTKVEVEPKFVGDWAQFLQKNLNPVVPVNNGAPAGQYTVVAQFIVDKEGTISDLKILTKHGYGMEEEVIKLMKLSPNWEPALQNGHKVTAYRKQPVTFVIAEE